MGNIIYMSQVMVQCGGSEVSVVVLPLPEDPVSKHPLAHGSSDVRWQLLSLQASTVLTNNAGK